MTGLSTSARALTRSERSAQLDRAEQLIIAATGKPAKPFFRPPYGDYNASVNADVAALGYDYNVMWTVDSRGWMGLSAAEITRRCIDLAEPGGLYVFHVGSASADAEAPPDIIGQLRATGYGFVTVAEFVPSE